jgi:hypothetical protein
MRRWMSVGRRRKGNVGEDVVGGDVVGDGVVGEDVVGTGGGRVHWDEGDTR